MDKKSNHKIFSGTYEGDLFPHIFGCKKNPGHTKFFPVNDFNINHLPKCCRDGVLLEFIMAVAVLTIRLVVKFTSCKRPDFWPKTNQPYPFYDKRGSHVVRLGTAQVCGVLEHSKEYIMLKNLGTCKCHKCQHSDTPSEVWGKIIVSTTNHIVFDEIEAKHTTCRLFFDEQDSPLVTIDGFSVKESDLESDICLIQCITCDVDLLDKLDKMVRHASSLSSRVHGKHKKRRDKDKIAIIISHPHGGPKQISIGQWIEKYELEDGGTRFTYTTDTCPGSSGAAVHLIGYNVLFTSRHLHYGCNSEGFNTSSIGKCFELEKSIKGSEINASVDLRIVVNNKEIKTKVDCDRLPTSVKTGGLKITIEKDTSSNASGRQESKEVTTIRTNHIYLLEQLLDNNLVSILFQENILDYIEKTEIDDQRTRKDKVNLMLDKVMSKCPSAYPIFLQALEKEHKHVVEKLRKAYNSL